MDPDGWLNINAYFISWMKLRLGPLGFQKSWSDDIVGTIIWTNPKPDNNNKNDYDWMAYRLDTFMATNDPIAQ